MLRQLDHSLRAFVLVMDVVLSAAAFVAALALLGPPGALVLTQAESLKLLVLGLIASLVWPLALQSTVVQRATRQLPVAALLSQLLLAVSHPEKLH